MTPRTIKGAQKLLKGLQQEAQVCSFSEFQFFQLFLDLCEDSRDHIFGPNTKCHTILESLRQVCFSPKKLIAVSAFDSHNLSPDDPKF